MQVKGLKEASQIDKQEGKLVEWSIIYKIKDTQDFNEHDPWTSSDKVVTHEHLILEFGIIYS